MKNVVMSAMLLATMPLFAGCHVLMMGGMVAGGGMGMMKAHESNTSCENARAAMMSHLEYPQAADSLSAFLPEHRARLDALLTACAPASTVPDTSEVMLVAMALRQDLTRLPELDKSNVAGFMPSHLQRVRRFLDLTAVRPTMGSE